MDFGTEKAIYLQISDYICEQILNGRWKAGERIVSVRELAAALEVNPNTAMRAYNELADKNVIVNKRGIGFFVSADAPELVRGEQKADFLRNELPRLFKKMHLLDITLDEIESIYKQSEKSINYEKENK